MKSCKKITAALIAIILVFSAFSYAVSATPSSQTDNVTVTETLTITPEDLTYVYPTAATEAPFDIGDLLPGDGINIDVNGVLAPFKRFFERIKELFDLILEYLQKISNEIYK